VDEKVKIFFQRVMNGFSDAYPVKPAAVIPYTGNAEERVQQAGTGQQTIENGMP
jgi:hypothetical protein